MPVEPFDILEAKFQIFNFPVRGGELCFEGFSFVHGATRGRGLFVNFMAEI